MSGGTLHQMNTATRLSTAATVTNIVGFGFAAYLAYEHFAAAQFQGCVLGGGCQQVTTSTYSRIFGVPVVLPGLVYFIVSGLMHLPRAWQSTNPWIHRARTSWAVVGMASVFYLIYGELSVEAICMYCTGVHVAVFVLFVLTLVGAALLAGNELADEDSE